MKMKFITIFLILLCCFMGAASAAEDISTDVADASIDDVVITDEAVDADLQADDSISAEPADADSEADQSDVSIETNDEEGNTRATTVTVNNWAQLAGNASSSGDKTINLASGVTYTPTSQIVFGNNAKIVGTSTSYISGSYSGIPFYGSNTNYHITFENVKFKDLSCTMVMQMLTSGTTVIKGCTFENVNASSSGHNSVIYNNYGTMNITSCVFKNCNAAFGVVTNHNVGSTTVVTMNVRNSKFENNHGYTEPGCINNCGILDVYNCTFNNNSAVQWAGAIHTHSNANTVINLSTFKNNVAGWNGGALYTYSTLKVYNSLFENNVCHSSTGGGAIGSYNFGSTYDIYIKNCTFINNTNDCNGGHGGAITGLNNGHLKVYYSKFINNHADVGQAICAYNQHIENGTGGNPYLVIIGCNFTNHTGNNDTVFVSGVVNAFNNNNFVNSPQTPIPGSGNVYNSIINPIMANSKGLLGSSIDDLLTGIQTEIYVNSSSTNYVDEWDPEESVSGEDWENAYGFDTGLKYATRDIMEGKDSKIHIAEGTYTQWDWTSSKYCEVIGYGDVIFQSDNCYDLDFGSEDNYYNAPPYFILDTSQVLFTYKNIIFDCDVKVGSKNFKFVNCTFKKGLTISHDYQYHNEFTPGPTEHFSDIFDIIFEGCTFEIPKSDINIVEEKNNVVFDENCKFPVTAVDSVVDISSSEKGTVTVTLTDKDSNAISGATFKYTVNGGDEQTAVTGDDGKYAITGLTGEVTVAVNYEGNESYNPISDSKSFNFTDEPAPSNDTNGSNSTPVTPTKVATKLTASKVTATYNVAKKLVITLTDKNGKALANKNVSVKVGSISKTLTTDKNGKVSLNVATLVPKTYTATVKFAGDSDYSASTASPKVVVSKAKVKLAAKAKTFKVKVKTKKYTVTLKNNKGKVMKKVKLTLKVGKKTYKATTNAKGKATFKITKLSKKGKYTATVKFAGSKYYKALSKKVKITVKK